MDPTKYPLTGAQLLVVAEVVALYATGAETHAKAIERKLAEEEQIVRDAFQACKEELALRQRA